MAVSSGTNPFQTSLPDLKFHSFLAHYPLCLIQAVKKKNLTAVCAITPKTDICLLSVLLFHEQ